MKTFIWHMLLLVVTQEVLSVVVQPDEDMSSFCQGCGINDDYCACTLTIEHGLTMLYSPGRRQYELVEPFNGQLRTKNGSILTENQARTVITADGAPSRLVITINNRFPGPRIIAYENQEFRIKFVNKMHTDSVTVHFHGLHQKGSPWMDGVAFVTQCPILPGQTFMYKFNAYPAGTSMYHAHIGDQRSEGLYGSVVIRKKEKTYSEDEIVMTLQDWNHDMDAETAYNRMTTQQFNLLNLNPINTTYSFDRGNFSRFVFHSGLVNGIGRYYTSFTDHNGAPLQRFKVKTGKAYRFRVIGATTLYPLRIYIEGQPLQLLASDGFEVEPIGVQSIVIQPGERYDFRWQVPNIAAITKKEIMFVAESLETDDSLTAAGLGYHAAEAVLEVEDFDGETDLNPKNNRTENCPASPKCVVFNCPFRYYPSSTNKVCRSFDDLKNNDLRKEEVSRTPDETLFFNFAFPPNTDNNDETLGAVNGKSFISPTVSMLTQVGGRTSCDTPACKSTGVCSCTYTADIAKDRLVQMVFLNLGSGRGWSHPVHLHGHSFYVMKMGYASYDNQTGVYQNESNDIECTELRQLCVSPKWAERSWDSGDIPGINDDPPEKDTIIVPTGGYVVIRFIADNPGMWFLHCHIDLHNTNGMGMVINEAGDQHPLPPKGFPTCGDFLYDDETRIVPISKTSSVSCTGMLTFLFVLIGRYVSCF